MQTFIFIWLGQLVSLVNSGLTSFAVNIWVYQTTGSLIQFTLLSRYPRLRLLESELPDLIPDAVIIDPQLYYSQYVIP